MKLLAVQDDLDSFAHHFHPCTIDDVKDFLEPPPDAPLPAPVLIIEDDQAQADRLGSLLGTLGYSAAEVHTAASLAEARKLLGKMPWALALVDMGLPDGSGLDLIPELRQLATDPGILVISAWNTREIILGALRLGATGYILKERDDLEITLSIRSVLRGGAPIDPFIAQRLITELRDTPAPAPDPAPEAALSSREEQILRLVANGLSNREIATQLYLSRYTVECHIKHIYRKLAVSSRTRAVNAARSHGLLD